MKLTLLVVLITCTIVTCVSVAPADPKMVNPTQPIMVKSITDNSDEKPKNTNTPQQQQGEKVRPTMVKNVNDKPKQEEQEEVERDENFVPKEKQYDDETQKIEEEEKAEKHRDRPSVVKNGRLPEELDPVKEKTDGEEETETHSAMKVVKKTQSPPPMVKSDAHFDITGQIEGGGGSMEQTPVVNTQRGKKKKFAKVTYADEEKAVEVGDQEGQDDYSLLEKKTEGETENLRRKHPKAKVPSHTKKEKKEKETKSIDHTSVKAKVDKSSKADGAKEVRPLKLSKQEIADQNEDKTGEPASKLDTDGAAIEDVDAEKEWEEKERKQEVTEGETENLLDHKLPEEKGSAVVKVNKPKKKVKKALEAY